MNKNCKKREKRAGSKPRVKTNTEDEEKEEEKKAIFVELTGLYLPTREIGRGSYGVVYKANSTIEKDYNKYAIKKIFPTQNANLIILEILFLKLLRGKRNIIQMIDGFRNGAQVDLIFNYRKTKPFAELVESFTIVDIRHYMHELLESIKSCTKEKLMHRDVKPSNFLYNIKERSGYLIDFGLGELHISGKGYIDQLEKEKNERAHIIKRIFQIQNKMNVKNRTGTRGYMAPETIFKIKNQGFGVDVWSAGVMFLSLLCKRHPIFSMNVTSKFKTFQIQNITPYIYLYGSQALEDFASKNCGNTLNSFSLKGYGICLPEEMPKSPINFKDLFHSSHKNDDRAVDLLKKMLCLDARERITIAEALRHPFFREVKQKTQRIHDK